MSRLAVLSWRRRLRCRRCGTRSRGRSLAGDMLATPDGWCCLACWQLAQVDNPPLREVEPAPRSEASAGGGAPLPLPGHEAAA
jgi:hypothetical protein